MSRAKEIVETIKCPVLNENIPSGKFNVMLRFELENDRYVATGIMCPEYNESNKNCEKIKRECEYARWKKI